MKIKSFILAIALSGITISAFSQKFELTTAKENYDKAAALRGNKLAEVSLNTAKESIDKASVHEKTSALPETWAYRALIYADLTFLNKDNPTKAEPFYAEAKKALEKAAQLDTKGEFKAKLPDANRSLYNYVLTKGVAEYKAAKYTDAYTSFETAGTLMPGDTTTAYFAGIAAQNSKRNADAIKKYTSLLTTNYSLLEDVYSNLSILYALEKDTASAIRISSEGAKRFPNNPNLATREIEFSLMTGKSKEVIAKIEGQAAKEPTNKLLPYYLGLAYSDPKVKDYVKAEEAYKRALAIDPNYVNANINLGGLIMNNGIEIYNAANKMDVKMVKEYEAEKKRATVEFDRSLPYLLKSVEIDPKSAIALSNLKRYYQIKNLPAKAAEVQAQLDALK